MFLYRSGPLFDWLKSQRDMSDCGRGSPVAFLEENNYLGPNLLAVHVNYLWRHDAANLARALNDFFHRMIPAARAALTMSPASGAAARLPYPAFSTITANAMRRSRES